MRNCFIWPRIFSIASIVLVFSGCGGGAEKPSMVASSMPTFTVGLKPLVTPDSMPLIQSCAWARSGDKLLLIGGRMQGFHGLTGIDSIFSQHYANHALWVVDLNDFSARSLPLDTSMPQWQPLCASNMEFAQSGDTLFVVGGFGARKASDAQSNFTFNTLMALSVSGMIRQVEQQGSPQRAVITTAQSPLLQVTGGELIRSGNFFYLMFGQNFEGAYNPGKTGRYTSAIRTFSLQGNTIVPVDSCIDSSLHRRDLNVVPVTQQSGTFYAGLGGVFTKNDDGYEQPVYFFPAKGHCAIQEDTLHQMSNQYNCAVASVYDPGSNSNFSILLGGIGEYRYLAGSGWNKGDHGAKLPFVRSITQMIYSNGQMQQRIQLPPEEPEMPALVGANGIFIPDSGLLYAPGVIDYSRIQSDTAVIGIMLGGILSTRPTSGPEFPTRVNPTVYQVLLYKNMPGSEPGTK